MKSKVAEHRVLPLEKGINLRDIGGYETIDGKHVKWGKIIRSGKIGQLTCKDRRYLKEYGVKTIFDLRSPLESHIFPDSHFKGVNTEQLAITPFANTVLANLRILKKRHFNLQQINCVNAMYAQVLVDPHAKAVIRTIFDELLNDCAQDCVLIHCASGNDRTAVIIFLILNALGVHRNLIKQDYLISNLVYQSLSPVVINELLRQVTKPEIVKQLNTNLVVNTQSFDILETVCHCLSGSVLNYLMDEIGLTVNELRLLRKMYLE